jgi:ABC-2 type transport system ATP-binding protein
VPEPDAAVISARDVGVRFSRGRQSRTLKDRLMRGQRGGRGGEFWALDGVSFDVGPGEAVGVVGRNGQGKSTLLKCIAGVMLPDRGSLRVGGGVAPLIEITGGFVSDLSVRDNIWLTAGLHGMSNQTIAGKFDEIVDFAEVDDFLDTPYKHLSSGMKVRVAFAVVSRLEEPIILVDEVLAVGDKVFKRKCYARIEEMIDAGRTLFLVSHNDADLRRFCTRGLYLRAGRLVVDGSMTETLAAYGRDGGEPA